VEECKPLIDGPGLERAFGITSVKVINDFAAVGYGVLDLGPDEIITLNGRIRMATTLNLEP
jgi:glucokinase